MATLNIGGRRVTVGDEFLSMSPEEQNAAVEEIAAQIGASGNEPAAQPESGSEAYQAALAAGSQASQFFDRKAEPARPDLIGSTAATLGGLVQGVPVVGPMAQNLSDAIIGTGLQLTGNGTMQEYRADAQRQRARIAEANPIASGAGTLASMIAAPLGAAKASSAAAAGLGLTGTTGQQIVNGGLSNATIATADASVRGNDPFAAALIGGASGLAGPVIGKGVEAAIKGVGNSVGPTIQAAVDPMTEALRRVGVAVGRDRAAGNALTAADEAVASAAGVPITNVDRGGETTRALARSVANQNSEARETLTSLAQERYKGQSGRAVDFIRRLTGGRVDDLAYQENLEATARTFNKRNYDAVEAAPNAQALFTKDIQELMQSPAVQRAIDLTGPRGADMAAIAGQKPVANPFRKAADGTWKLVQKADGSITLPNLRFWNQVKINLDGMIGSALKSGDKTEYSVLKQLKDKLVGSLDAAVPEYRVARQGAAAAFGADNAVDAGRVFARSPGQIPEATRSFAKFSQAEKEAFGVGYASELIDRIKIRGDSQNVIKAAFESPAAREMNELVFGPQKARELEAYVRVEAIADRLRGALGNSTTARQLVELGIGGGAGFALSGDWQGAVAGALFTKGAKYAGQKVDAKVMENVAKLLTSGTRADLDRAVQNAALSQEWMKALTYVEQALAGSIKGGGLALAAAQS